MVVEGMKVQISEHKLVRVPLSPPAFVVVQLYCDGVHYGNTAAIQMLMMLDAGFHESLLVLVTRQRAINQSQQSIRIIRDNVTVPQGA